MYMIVSDTALDLTCRVMFLRCDPTTGLFCWTADPAHAYRWDREAVAQTIVNKARAGALREIVRAFSTTMLDARPRAEVIPAMEENADGEWVDGSWQHAEDLERSL